MTTETGGASAHERTIRRYIVVFDDDQGACWPMGWDSDCDGALCAMHNGKVAVFEGRPQARAAIKISAAFAKLRAAQGLPVNSDFTEGMPCVKLMELVYA